MKIVDVDILNATTYIVLIRYKPAHDVTSIKQSHVLNDHFFLALS
jgi:hypothetical protein